MQDSILTTYINKLFTDRNVIMENDLKIELIAELKQNFKNMLHCYIDNIDCDDEPNLINTPKEYILEWGFLYLKSRFKALLKYDDKYQNQTSIIFNV